MAKTVIKTRIIKIGNSQGVRRVDRVVKRFDVYLLNLALTVEHEIQKTRLCLIVSPDEMNRYIATVIVAP